MTLEERIAEILRTSAENSYLVSSDKNQQILLWLAREIVDGLEHHGWRIEQSDEDL
jgi:hypothetical protein